MTSSPPEKSPLVLIVDDAEDIRLMYSAFLEYRGFETATAPSAKTAFAIASERRPSVIIMDYAMPETDGVSAARQLAMEPSTASIAILIVTGHVTTLQPDTVQAAGACGLITKPCLPEVLEAEVRRVLAGNREFRSVRGTPLGR